MERKHFLNLGDRSSMVSIAAGFSSYDGDLSVPLGLALGSPIFPSGCEGKLGVDAIQPSHPLLSPFPQFPHHLLGTLGALSKVKFATRMDLATPWTAAHQAPPSMGFSTLATRGEDWASQGQPKGNAEIPVVTRECRRNSRKTTPGYSKNLNT